MRPAGISLVEILVVIAIIAILIGILMPALRRGRELSMRVQCESNVQQIMIASLAYAADSHSYLPYANWSGLDSTYTGPGSISPMGRRSPQPPCRPARCGPG
jgi:prepilin-type N-terminal cleavage/methylation domain-containing protein